MHRKIYSGFRQLVRGISRKNSRKIFRSAKSLGVFADGKRSWLEIEQAFLFRKVFGKLTVQLQSLVTSRFAQTRLLYELCDGGISRQLLFATFKQRVQVVKVHCPPLLAVTVKSFPVEILNRHK